MIGDSKVRPRLLRNPVYVGKVFFRGALHDGPHPHLVDDKVFDRVQALLTERGEDWSKRASATSPFLLAGLVVCARCGKHFVGTSAVGNRYRYRYYTCSTRQRYGTKYCDAERLPAEELDAAILDALLHVYERTDLFDKAVAAARCCGTPSMKMSTTSTMGMGRGLRPNVQSPQVGGG